MAIKVTVQLAEPVHKALVRFKAEQESRTGEIITMSDAVAIALASQPKGGANGKKK